VRSLIDGATPESAHFTVKGDPPGKLSPAVEGTVKTTSPNANGTDAKRNNKALLSRMVTNRGNRILNGQHSSYCYGEVLDN
jgi:hypothetical protein